MPFNGSGIFTITTAGFPAVPGTTIQSTMVNSTILDLGEWVEPGPDSGWAGRSLSVNLPMGGYRHLNVGKGTGRAEYARIAESQDGEYQWFTAGGTADAITGALSPALPAYITGQGFRFKATGNNTGPVTVNLNSLGAKALTKNGTNALVAGDLISGAVYSIAYDGNQFQVISGVAIGGLGTAAYLNAGTAAGNLPQLDGTGKLPAVDGSQLTNLPIPTVLRVGTRQVPLSGPIDSGSGQPNFLPATSGSLTLTTTGISAGTPLIVTASNGFGASGEVDRVGQAVANLAFSCAASATNYLYLEVAANGTVTAGTTTLPPVYQWIGTPSVTNGQHTFNIQEMKMYVGNGSVATQVYRVFIGEAVTGVSSVTSTVPYGYLGRFNSGIYTQGTNTFGSRTHNLGLTPEHLQFELFSRGNGSGQVFKPAILRNYNSSGQEIGTAYYSDTATRNSVALDYANTATSLLDNGNGAATSDFILNIKRRW